MIQGVGSNNDLAGGGALSMVASSTIHMRFSENPRDVDNLH